MMTDSKTILIEKAKQVFVENTAIKTNEGLSRKELRQLERMGVVEKLKMFESRKFSNIRPQQYYLWRLKDAKD